MKKAHGNANDLPGKLYIVEGCDGSGKSTQLFLLKNGLKAGDISYFLPNGTRRNS